jgi:hypothetical protein
MRMIVEPFRKLVRTSSGSEYVAHLKVPEHDVQVTSTPRESQPSLVVAFCATEPTKEQKNVTDTHVMVLKMALSLGHLPKRCTPS